MCVVLIGRFSSRDLQNVSYAQNSKSLKTSSRFFVLLRGTTCINNVVQCSAEMLEDMSVDEKGEDTVKFFV